MTDHIYSTSSGTIRPPPRLELNTANLLSYLQLNFPTSPSSSTIGLLQLFSEKLDVQLFAHGQSNPTYKIIFRGESYVLRKQPPGKLLPGAHLVLREANLLIHLKSNYSHIPVPKVILVCDDVTVIGSQFYLMEYIDGIIYKNNHLPTLSETDRRLVYESMIRVLSMIHSIPIIASNNTSGSEDLQITKILGYKPGFATRQIKLWKGQFDKSHELSPTNEDNARGMQKLSSLLSAETPSTDLQGHYCPLQSGNGLVEGETEYLGPRIVHGDFRLDNIIFDPNQPSKILAVIDWELVSIGDPMLDLSYLFIPYYLPPIGLLSTISLRSNDFLVPSKEDLFVEYSNYLNRRLSINLDSKEWNFYLCLSLYRMASISAGVFARAMVRLHNKQKAISLNTPSALKHSHPATSSRDDLSLAFGGLVKVLLTLALQQMSKPSIETEPSVGKGIRSHLVPGDLCQQLLMKLRYFNSAHVLKVEDKIISDYNAATGRWPDRGDKWTIHPLMEELSEKAKSMGLWNCWMSESIVTNLKETHADWDWQKILPHGVGLSHTDYAFLAMETGRSLLTSEIINCSAPDTGNMEILAKFGSRLQQTKWLLPLLLGEIRSCFAMTEKNVSSSDPTQLQATATKVTADDGTIGWRINGRKWWTTGACDPRCRLSIVVTLTEAATISDEQKGGSSHRRHTLFLVPMDAPGVKVVRPLHVFGYDDAPHGHAEVVFDNVFVAESKHDNNDNDNDSVTNPLLGLVGRGFDLAQARLGPGRLHHCARLVGHAQRALDAIIDRGISRKAFKKPLLQLGGNSEKLAYVQIKTQQSRLLLLAAAAELDESEECMYQSTSTSSPFDHRLSNSAIEALAIAKVAIPQSCQECLDFAIQIHGGGGLSWDHPLAAMWAACRALRIVDGPDEVHLRSIAKLSIERHQNQTNSVAFVPSDNPMIQDIATHPGVGKSRL